MGKHLFYTLLLAAGFALGHQPHRIITPPLAYNAYPQPPAPSVPKYQRGKDSSLQLRMEMGGCSGTLFGKSHHVVLTAMHCVNLGGSLVKVNGKPVNAQVLSSDGHDHVFIHVDQYLPGRPAKIAPMPAAGTEIYVWGNPADMSYVLRVGHVAGKYVLEGIHYELLDINTWHGDSGSAFFDADGNIVAVNEGLRYDQDAVDEYGKRASWSIAIAQPLAFTPQQLREAGA